MKIHTSQSPDCLKLMHNCSNWKVRLCYVRLGEVGLGWIRLGKVKFGLEGLIHGLFDLLKGTQTSG